jgi:hypothetical protein
MAARSALHRVGEKIPTMTRAGMSIASAKRRKLLLRAKVREAVMVKVKAKMAVEKAKAREPNRKVTRLKPKLLETLK